MELFKVTIKSLGYTDRIYYTKSHTSKGAMNLAIEEYDKDYGYEIESIIPKKLCRINDILEVKV